MALSEIGKHNSELATRIANNGGTLRVLTGGLTSQDWELKQYSCTCLANIAKHNEELARAVCNAELFPRIITCLKDDNDKV